MAYTTINKSTAHFNTKLYTGNDTGQSITGVGFQPDWVWIKSRSDTNQHNLFTPLYTGFLESDTSDAVNGVNNGVTAYGADGFTVGTRDAVNDNNLNFASWNWKAGGGAGSANTDGSINSTVSVNTTAGFSIVKYVGDGGMTTTVGHGLGVVPQVILIKNLETATNWTMYHHSMGNTGQLYLDTTTSFTTDADTFKNTTPTSTLWTMSNSSKTNQGSRNHIAYCFAEKTGYSKFGSYTGNTNNGDGTFVYTGFKPAFIMVKNTARSQNWSMHDSKRPGYNEVNQRLQANLSDAEASNNKVDLLSNGFKWRTNDGDTNGYAEQHIYMAFAEAPLVGSNNVPCTAR